MWLLDSVCLDVSKIMKNTATYIYINFFTVGGSGYIIELI